MWPILTDVGVLHVAWSVCICLLGTRVSCAKNGNAVFCQITWTFVWDIVQQQLTAMKYMQLWLNSSEINPSDYDLESCMAQIAAQSCIC